MTVLDKLNFVAFHTLQNNNSIVVRRRKLMARIDEQIQLSKTKATRFYFRAYRPSFIRLCKSATIEWENRKYLP